jgi:hypothetical protein
MRTLPYLLLTGVVLAGSLPAMADETAPSETPDVMTYREGTNTIEEYRTKGYLRAVRVTPTHGTPYFLVRADGDSNFVRADNPNMRIPAWELFSW